MLSFLRKPVRVLPAVPFSRRSNADLRYCELPCSALDILAYVDRRADTDVAAQRVCATTIQLCQLRAS